jgi:hypothetical protein
MGQFADLFDEEKPTQQRAAMNLRFGIEAQPDVAARDQALARRFGLPPAVIEQYRPDYAARAAVADAAPVLERWTAASSRWRRTPGSCRWRCCRAGRPLR